MGTVRNILAIKGNSVHTVDVGSTVYDALDTLENLNIGALVVTDQGYYAGIFTERDYARKVILSPLGIW